MAYDMFSDPRMVGGTPPPPPLGLAKPAPNAAQADAANILANMEQALAKFGYNAGDITQAGGGGNMKASVGNAMEAFGVPRDVKSTTMGPGPTTFPTTAQDVLAGGREAEVARLQGDVESLNKQRDMGMSRNLGVEPQITDTIPAGAETPAVQTYGPHRAAAGLPALDPRLYVEAGPGTAAPPTVRPNIQPPAGTYGPDPRDDIAPPVGDMTGLRRPGDRDAYDDPVDPAIGPVPFLDEEPTAAARPDQQGGRAAIERLHKSGAAEAGRRLEASAEDIDKGVFWEDDRAQKKEDAIKKIAEEQEVADTKRGIRAQQQAAAIKGGYDPNEPVSPKINQAAQHWVTSVIKDPKKRISFANDKFNNDPNLIALGQSGYLNEYAGGQQGQGVTYRISDLMNDAEKRFVEREGRGFTADDRRNVMYKVLWNHLRRATTHGNELMAQWRDGLRLPGGKGADLTLPVSGSYEDPKYWAPNAVYDSIISKYAQMFDWWGDGPNSVSGAKATSQLKAKLLMQKTLGLFANMSMPGGGVAGKATAVDEHISRSIDPKDIAPPPEGLFGRIEQTLGPVRDAAIRAAGDAEGAVSRLFTGEETAPQKRTRTKTPWFLDPGQSLGNKDALDRLFGPEGVAMRRLYQKGPGGMFSPQAEGGVFGRGPGGRIPSHEPFSYTEGQGQFGESRIPRQGDYQRATEGLLRYGEFQANPRIGSPAHQFLDEAEASGLSWKQAVGILADNSVYGPDSWQVKAVVDAMKASEAGGTENGKAAIEEIEDLLKQTIEAPPGEAPPNLKGEESLVGKEVDQSSTEVTGTDVTDEMEGETAEAGVEVTQDGKKYTVPPLIARLGSTPGVKKATAEQARQLNAATKAESGLATGGKLSVALERSAWDNIKAQEEEGGDLYDKIRGIGKYSKAPAQRAASLADSADMFTRESLKSEVAASNKALDNQEMLLELGRGLSEAFTLIGDGLTQMAGGLRDQKGPTSIPRSIMLALTSVGKAKQAALTRLSIFLMTGHLFPEGSGEESMTAQLQTLQHSQNLKQKSEQFLMENERATFATWLDHRQKMTGHKLNQAEKDRMHSQWLREQSHKEQVDVWTHAENAWKNSNEAFGDVALEAPMLDTIEALQRTILVGEDVVKQKRLHGTGWAKNWWQGVANLIGVADPDWHVFKQLVTVQLNTYVHELTGKQLSRHEVTRLKGAVPQMFDSDAVFMAKAQSFVAIQKDILRNKLSVLALNGHDVSRFEANVGLGWKVGDAVRKGTVGQFRTYLASPDGIAARKAGKIKMLDNFGREVQKGRGNYLGSLLGDYIDPSTGKYREDRHGVITPQDIGGNLWGRHAGGRGRPEDFERYRKQVEAQNSLMRSGVRSGLSGFIPRG